MDKEPVYTTKMSSKGQVVIPEAVRDSLGLTSGTQFVAVGKGDSIILKVIEQPSLDEFKELMKKAKSDAKIAGITKSNLKQAIKQGRKGRSSQVK